MSELERINELESRIVKLETTVNRLIIWLGWFLHSELGNRANLIYDILEEKPPEYLALEEEEKKE